jgi:addiction module HigA family antidote
MFNGVSPDKRTATGPDERSAARKLGVSRKQLSDVLNGHSGISPEMAIRLHKASGGGADTWFRLQAAYDLAQAMKKSRSRSSGLRVRRDRR